MFARSGEEARMTRQQGVETKQKCHEGVNGYARINTLHRSGDRGETLRFALGRSNRVAFSNLGQRIVRTGCTGKSARHPAEHRFDADQDLADRRRVGAVDHHRVGFFPLAQALPERKLTFQHREIGLGGIFSKGEPTSQTLAQDLDRGIERQDRECRPVFARARRMKRSRRSRAMNVASTSTP